MRSKPEWIFVFVRLFFRIVHFCLGNVLLSGPNPGLPMTVRMHHDRMGCFAVYFKMFFNIPVTNSLSV